MTESTMATLWNSWGGGTAPRLVNGKMVSFTPSSGDSEAFLTFGDGECKEVIYVDLIDKFNDNCYSAVLGTLKVSNYNNTIKEILSNLDTKSALVVTLVNTRMVFGVTPEGEYEYDSSVDGDHIQDSENSSEITLNDDALGGASQEYIAATIIHEVLHAHFSSKGLNLSELAEHNEMAASYMEPMAQALNNIYGLSLAEARALAWGGLHETQDWTLLSTTEKNDIITINHNYKNLNGTRSESPGTNCP